MIFKPEMVEKILAGEKTVTRRPVKYVANQFLEAVVEKACRYEVGKDYAVQPVIESGLGKGRGGKEVARLRVTSVIRMPLKHYLLTAECNREGFTHFTAFRDYWAVLYGSYDPTQLVDRIEFELLAADKEQSE